MIMALLFGLGMASYRSFSQRKAVEKVSVQIRNDLLLIQQYALSGKKPNPPDANCESPNFLEGYIFRGGGTGYRIYADCSTGGYISVKYVNLDTNGPLIESVSRVQNCSGSVSNLLGNYFEFRTLAGGIYIRVGSETAPMPASDCIRVRISQGTNVYDIIVDSTGAIR